MAERRRLRPLLAGGVLGAAAAALAGCLDLSLLPAIAFPPGIPGLPAPAAWVRLPVDAWVTEGGVEALGLAACLSSECGGPAVVGLFAATGRDAEELRRAAAAPAALATLLRRAPIPPKGAQGRAKAPRVAAEARPVRHGAATGLAVALVRADGAAAAFGEALVASAGPRTLAMVVVGRDADGVSRLVAGIAASL